MQPLILYAGTAFMGFLAIMNPIANTPVFLGLTAEDDPKTRKTVAAKALLLAFLIVTVFTVGGQYIFALFGITLPAFRITGGVLVFQIGLHMLQGEQSKLHQPGESAARQSREAQLGVAISPLAVPILAGPGTIATATSLVATGGLAHLVVTIGAFGVMCLVSYGFFVSGERLIDYVGATQLVSSPA